MKREECFELGTFGKTHGIKGQLWLDLDVDDPSAYQELEAVFVEENAVLVPYFVESCSRNGSRLRLKLEDIDHLDSARTLSGKTALLPLKALPDLEEGEWYLHDFVGFTVRENKQGVLGIVKDVYDLPNNTLLVLEYQGREVLIPLQDHFIEKNDTQNKVLYMQLPEGLLEVYLEDDNKK